MPPIIGPQLDGYKRPLRPRPLKPYLELAAIEAEHVRPEPPATGQLSASMPAEHLLAAHVEERGNVARAEEAVAHRPRRPLSELLERIGSSGLRSTHWVTGAVPGGAAGSSAP